MRFPSFHTLLAAVALSVVAPATSAADLDEPTGDVILTVTLPPTGTMLPFWISTC